MSRYDDPTEALQGPRISQNWRLRTGDEVDGFIVESECASGGFGTVYRARSAETNQPVALKVLHPHLLAVGNNARRFKRETEAIRRIRHPNIVDVLAIGEIEAEPGRPAAPYFVMEWLEGKTLAQDLSERGSYSLDDVVAITRDLCAALDAAHGVGIVHRDLKASNVMLHEAGDGPGARLVDFGIAKLVTGDGDQEMSRLTATGTQIGTPHYMAPEQVRGLTKDVDLRTDLYALGVLIYLMLTGAFPFDGESLAEIHDKHLHTAAPNASDVAPIPVAVSKVVCWCLEKRRDDRPGSAAEVAEAIERAALGTPARATPVSRAVAVHVQGKVACPDKDIDDDLLDEFDERLVECRDQLVAAGLQLETEASNSLLASALLPNGDGADAEKARVLDFALSLAKQLEDTTDERLRFSITVHEGDTGPGVDETTLHSVSEWAATETDGALIATREALEGVLDQFEVSPIDREQSRFTIVGRR